MTCSYCIIIILKQILSSLQEGANVTHIVGKLDGVLRGIADHRNKAANAANHTSQPDNLQDRIQKVRVSVSDQGNAQEREQTISERKNKVPNAAIPTSHQQNKRINKVRNSVPDQAISVESL